MSRQPGADHWWYWRSVDLSAIRTELDPQGVFLNAHLRELFA